jgi:putative transposase
MRKSPAVRAAFGKNEALIRKDREWTCLEYGARHDRGMNVVLNLERLAIATALPVASPAGNGGAAAGKVPVAAGEVTPVSYECAQRDTSGQEENRTRFRAHF